MHRCPLVTRHSLTSIAVGKVMNMLSIIIVNMGLPPHIVHAFVMSDVA